MKAGRKNALAMTLIASLLVGHLFAGPWGTPNEQLNKPSPGDGEAKATISGNTMTVELWLESYNYSGAAGRYIDWRYHAGGTARTNVWSSNSADSVSNPFGADCGTVQEVRGVVDLLSASGEVSNSS